MNFILGIIVGAAALAAWQIYREMKAGSSLKQAARNVISGGGGPGSGELPK
jgi:hypothetical protein